MPFRVAVSGLRAAQADLNVIGNNIANVATTGFKNSRAEFKDVYSISNIGSAGDSPGRGLNVSRIAQQFSQGNISFTDNGMDLAISGNGFFILDDNGSRKYTRDGAFGLDREGYVVNSANQRLVAFGADSTGTITGATGPLRIDLNDISPQATGRIDIGINLDASEDPPGTAVFDPLDASSYNRSTAVSVYDSLGGQHTLQMFFLKQGAPAVNSWSTYTVVDGVATSGPSTMAFDSAGALATPANGQITIPTFTPATGVDPMDVTIDFSGSTQFGKDFGVNALAQDGFSSGRFSGIDIDEQGVLLARFTNGRSRVQGQVALATFANVQGLQPIGESAWVETFASGAQLEGAPGTASLGLIQAGALEDSNVDLSEQLVKLIVAQRNYQANTEVISAADTVTQAVINIR
ncbi:MAG: flagellar hook protein FlgE [Gammaproteobacteria bacterium]|nr:flagellar hook protein FlgE [Gammaproteobacteria bacterium]